MPPCIVKAQCCSEGAVVEVTGGCLIVWLLWGKKCIDTQVIYLLLTKDLVDSKAVALSAVLGLSVIWRLRLCDRRMYR